MYSSVGGGISGLFLLSNSFIEVKDILNGRMYIWTSYNAGTFNLAANFDYMFLPISVQSMRWIERVIIDGVFHYLSKYGKSAIKRYPTTMSNTVKIGDLTWLAGGWVGEKDGAQIEEQWSPPAGNAMMCMFRWIQADQVRFYEFVVIEQEGEGLVLRIKHFNPGLIEWEDKGETVSFTLVQLAGQKVVFTKQDAPDPLWLIYHRLDNDILIAYFESAGGASIPAEDEFRFKLREAYQS
jgi:hypothetical protein